MENQERPLTPEQELLVLRQEIQELREEKLQWLKEKEELIRERDLERKNSNTDPLTGIDNRRSLENMAKKLLPRDRAEGSAELELAKEQGHYVVGFFDLDNFKTLNTEHGHIKADEVLKTAAEVLKGFVRESDVVARYGGEEFVVIFTNANGNDIKARLFDEATGRWKVSFTTEIDGTEIHSSFSGGMTDVREGETAKDFKAILERANQAMRDAKAGGKNQVRQFEAGSSDPSPS